MLNNYNKIADIYKESNTKPDKLYSILPTVLHIAQNASISPKVITDLGCGDGFFTFPLSRMYPNAEVVGIDNSEAQIEKAQQNKKTLGLERITFAESDIFTDSIHLSDMIVAPFVFGYCLQDELKTFLMKLKNSIQGGGVLVVVLDDPKGIDNKKYGAKKTVVDNNLEIELYDNSQKYIATLHAIYHNPKSFISLLEEVGFTKITVHNPIVSDEGLQKYGQEWWGDYAEHSELCYISCVVN